MQSSARLIRAVVKFTACMQRRKDKPLRRHAFCVHADRNATSIVLYRRTSVFFQCDLDVGAVAGQMLIYRVVHDLVNEVIQSFSRNASDVHARTLPDSFESFQHRNRAGVICVAFCHVSFLSFLSLFYLADT